MPWSRFDSNYQAAEGDRDITFVEAIREATDQAMELDPREIPMLQSEVP